MRKPLSLRPGFVRTALAGVLLVANAWFPASAAVPVSEPRTTFQPYHARFGRERPVIAVVGDHHGTGLTDLATHDSEVFRPELGVNLRAFAATYLTNRWFHGTDRVRIAVGLGVDDLALAMTADAYSRTGRSQAFAFAASRAPTPTRAGLGCCLNKPCRRPTSAHCPHSNTAPDARRSTRCSRRLKPDTADRPPVVLRWRSNTRGQ